MTNDIIDTYLLAGYDVGTDTAFGLQQTGGEDLPGNGDVGMVMARGRFARSYIGAGVLPAGPLTDALPAAGQPSSGRTGTIGMVRFGSINAAGATMDFGLFAATNAPTGLDVDPNDRFVVEILG